MSRLRWWRHRFCLFHQGEEIFPCAAEADKEVGHISAVSYDSNVPVERTLQSFAINLTNSKPTSFTLTATLSNGSSFSQSVVARKNRPVAALLAF